MSLCGDRCRMNPPDPATSIVNPSTDVLEMMGLLSCVVSSRQADSLISWHCQNKIHYFAPASETHFSTVDFPGFSWIKWGGTTSSRSIQNFTLTVPPRELKRGVRADAGIKPSEVALDGQRESFECSRPHRHTSRVVPLRRRRPYAVPRLYCRDCETGDR
jgi:hypothetical protein